MLSQGHVLELAEVEAGAHFGIIAGTVVLTLGYAEAGAEVAQGVAPERVDSTGRRQRAFPFQRWEVQMI